MKKLPQSAIEACRPRLISELAEAEVDTAVLMGNSAIHGLLPASEARRGVNKLRAGPPKSIGLLGHGDEIDYVATFHPAACLRNQSQFPLMLNDVGKATAHNKPMGWYEPEVVVIDKDTDLTTLHNTINEIKALNRGQGVVVDTESGFDKDSAFGRDDGIFGNVLCIGIGPMDPSNGDRVYVFTHEAILNGHAKPRIKLLLEECGIVAHNGKYDIGVLMNYLDSDEPFPLIADTMLASYCLNEVGGIHGLKYMGQELLGTPEWEHEIKPFITKEQGYGSIPSDLLHKYNAFDVHVTRLLHGYLSNQINEQGLTSLYNFLLRLSPMLTKVERAGIGFDLTYSKTLAVKFKGELARLEDLLPVNPRSPKQVKEYFQEFNFPMESTDADHLKLVIESDKFPEPLRRLSAQILESRGHTKMDSNYVSGLQKKLTQAGTVHTTYLIHGTTTGRLSSRGPNLQNVPRAKEIKRQFIPQDPNNVLVQVDFSQAELRVLTWLARDEYMRALFNDPTRDVFTELCRSMFPDFHTLSPVDQTELRTLIKTFAYGISYGRTAAGIAADPDFHMSIAQAEAHMKTFQKMIPGIMEFQADVLRKVHSGEDLVNPFGRHRRFYLITEQNQSSVENEAMAYLPQSTASDICLEAACRLSAEGVNIRNLIHDAILLETHPDNADDLALHVNETMVAVADELTLGYVRFATAYQVGRTWADV